MSSNLIAPSYGKQPPALPENWLIISLVAAVRIAVLMTIIMSGLALLDDPRLGNGNPFILNCRLGVWLMLAEALYQLRETTYLTPRRFTATLQLAVSEMVRVAWSAAWRTPLSLLFRWTLIAIATTGSVFCLGNSPVRSLWAAFLPTLVFRLFRNWLPDTWDEPAFDTVVRGTHLGTYLEASQRATALAQTKATPATAESHLLSLGGVDLPAHLADPYSLFLGIAGTGKTLLLRLLMRSALIDEYGELRSRALFYDAKREFVPLLRGMGIRHDDIVLLNPADARSFAWDIAADITNKDDARNIAVALIPDPERGGRENPFFLEATQALMAEVMFHLHLRAPNAWSLNDVLIAMATPEMIRDVLRATESGRATYMRYFTEAREATGGIISTIDTKVIAPYETVATLGQTSPARQSVRQWAQDTHPRVLVIGSDENSASVDRINQAIFRRISQVVLGKPELANDPDHASDLTWFFLDEARFAGALPLLPQLMTLGRSKGVRAAFAMQDLDGFYDAYGHDKANELLALCGNVHVFRLSSPRTREWASKLFGEYEGWEQDYSSSTTDSDTFQPSWLNRRGWYTSRSESRTRGKNRKIVKREAILSSEFFTLPKANLVDGIPGFFATPALGAWRGPIPASYLTPRLAPRDNTTPGFIAHPPSDHVASGWSTQRYTLFCGAGEQPQLTAPAAAPPEAPAAQPSLFDLAPSPTPPPLTPPPPTPRRRGRLPD